VVDLAAVVSNSEQVKALQAEQNAKAQELTQWLQNAQKEVNKEKDEAKKNELLQKYNAEFAQKREALAQQYAVALQKVDASITETITNEAKKLGYTLVLAKGTTIYGGDDITEQVAKVVK
jgi:Skp family chaperone for outer membrane proteins